MIGISKRELLCDYYPDELPAIFETWGDMHGVKREPEAKEMTPMEFLSM